MPTPNSRSHRGSWPIAPAPLSSSAATPNFQVELPSTDIQINGGLDSGNGTVAFFLDGSNNITGMRNLGNPAPNPDAIEEFRVDFQRIFSRDMANSPPLSSLSSQSREQTGSTAVCSSSIAIPTSMLTRGKSQHLPARPLSTAITSAAPSAAPSGRISPSSSSGFCSCTPDTRHIRHRRCGAHG